MAAEGTLPLVRHAACAVAAASAVYATTLALSGGSHDVAEDITDFVHSAAAVRASSQSALSFERTRSKHAIALRPADDAAARRFLCASTAYFGADACFVCVQLSRGVRPRLWAGRLAHHAVQFAANGPALAGSSGRAVRPYLMLAYMAEVSTLFLRLRSLLRRAAPERAGLIRATSRLLLASFAVTRLLNFPLCTALIWARRDVLRPAILKLHLAFAAAGITLNAGWFVALLRSASREAGSGRRRVAPASEP